MCSHTKKNTSGVHTACIKNTKARLRKARSEDRTGSAQGFEKNLTRGKHSHSSQVGESLAPKKTLLGREDERTPFSCRGQGRSLGKPGERAGGWGEIWPEGGGECSSLLSCRCFRALGGRED